VLHDVHVSTNRGLLHPILDGIVVEGKTNMARSRGSAEASVFKPTGRNVPGPVRLFLFVRSGGRCEFDGCNRYLIEHHLTKTEGNFAEMAHIWAFSEQGPRGHEAQGAEPHELSNLMLLCPTCHKLVDSDAKQYTVEVLRKHKKAHEDRVFMLTDTKPDRHTVAFVLRAKIGGRHVKVSLPEIQEAVAPSYVGARDVVETDLTALSDEASDHYWRAASEAIRTKARTLYEQNFDDGPARNVSVFALAPIPLLVFLGGCLSDKVPTRLYQRHRDSENWKWKDAGDVVAYETNTLRQGADPHCVALLLSLSGRIAVAGLPDEIDARYSVYEITLAGAEPSPRFLEVEESLRAFRDEYMLTMRNIVAAHDGLEQLHLFPAVPAPAAIAVGRDLMPKRDPAVLVYDFDKRAGGYVQTLEVNKHDA
jgi:hypothetical protein